MAINEKLPPEILCRILTIGCDVPPIIEPYYSLDYSYVEEGFPQSHRRYGRRLKSFIANASSVCRLWHSLSMLKSNYHFWVIGLSLDMWHNARPHDMGRQLHHFKSNLASSQGSVINLTISIRIDVDLSSAARHTDAITLRLLLHGINMLRPHLHRLRALDATVEGHFELNFIISTLSSAPLMPQFRVLRINSDPWDV